MDPGSIFGVISGAFQLVQVITQTAAGLATLREKFSHADLTIRSLLSQLSTIERAITELDEWARFNTRDTAEENEIDEGLFVALDGCRAVMDVLSDQVATLTRGNDTQFGIGTRVKILWNEDIMRGHQDRLHAQILALQLLVQACNCKSTSDQLKLLRRAENRQIIQRVASDTATLRSSSSYAASRADSSSLSHRQSSSGDTIFDFDGRLLSSPPYRRILSWSRAETQSTASNGNESRSTDEGYGSGSVNTPNMSRASSLVLPVLPYDTTRPGHGHSKSVSFRPSNFQPNPTQFQRWQSDSTPSSPISRSSSSKREKIRAAFRQLSRSKSVAHDPVRTLTGGSMAARRINGRDMHTSIDLTTPEGAAAPLIVKTAQSGSRSDVERLIESCHDIEACHVNTRRNALLVASHCGNEEIVELLLQRNARLNVTDKSGSTALHLAASRGHCEVLKLLLLEGIDTEAPNSRGRTALWLAAENGQLEAANILIAGLAKVNARAENQMTPLHTAAKEGHEAVVEFLVSNGADLEARDGTMMTALHHACEEGHMGVVELLLTHKADIDAVGSDNRTPLVCAAAMGRLQVTQALLKRKASPRQVDDASMTALHWAAYNGHTEVVDLLSQKKDILAVTNIAGRSALHLAVLNSKFAVVELLLRKRVPMETQCRSGFAPLHYACITKTDNTGIVKLLLISGANIEVQTKDQQRPIHLAAARGSIALLNLLCDKGASLIARDAIGDRALCAACRYGHTAAVQHLLDRGSPLSLPYDDKLQEDSPLCLAAMGGHLPIVTLLLQRGASVLKKDEQGWQPYHHAAHYGHPDVLRLLLSCSPTGWVMEGASEDFTMERIGFSPSADISEEKKKAIQDLLSESRRRPVATTESIPPGVPPFLGDVMLSTMPTRGQNRPSGLAGNQYVPFTGQVPVIQELPGTLEQGLPPSRSTTPEQMHRDTRPRRGSGTLLQALPEQGSPEQHIATPRARYPQALAERPQNEDSNYHLQEGVNSAAVGGSALSDLPPGTVYHLLEEWSQPCSTASPVSMINNPVLEPSAAVKLAREVSCEGPGRESDAESISSVYTAPEGVV
ncbi:ankyrin repeat protein [Aspergillus nomiae NRRL 13137]|uniref:Ankyrin repeat protein n=2 Tax=Aspergillus subgen. Circumdati TaxID=2720871 RepID=A0A0L1J239_ASPN3|nr:ankyrin repeat protein [Aspergillus nomiae NRRL 13137]KNG85819.1 ankyrin repeat protein [Aspergillus nomiae NRRL 13137]